LTKLSESRDDLVIGRVLVRGLLNVARESISAADAVVRKNRLAGDPDDPESIRKLRLSFRRVQYQLTTMSEVDHTLNAKPLIRQLREIGRPFGRLRDAEILELRVTKALGDRRTTPEGRQLIDIVAAIRRVEQQATDSLLNSMEYLETLRSINEFRSSLPPDAVSPAMARPVARRAVAVTWRGLRSEAKRAVADPTDANLHLMRIAGKRMVYSTQAYSYVLGGPADELARRVDAMQKFLGRQHDHVIVSVEIRRVGKDHPLLRELANALSAEERQRADDCARHWPRYWVSVRDLHPRESVLTH